MFTIKNSNLFAMLAGTLQLDLPALIKPATTARTCKLPVDGALTVDLFKQKRCYGWWTVSSMKSGTLKDTVRVGLFVVPLWTRGSKIGGFGRDAIPYL